MKNGSSSSGAKFAVAVKSYSTIDFLASLCVCSYISKQKRASICMAPMLTLFLCVMSFSNNSECRGSACFITLLGGRIEEFESNGMRSTTFQQRTKLNASVCAMRIEK